MQQALDAREHSLDRLTAAWVDFLTSGFGGARVQDGSHAPNAVNILTLSNSSTIRAAVLAALDRLRWLKLHLTILESRPQCEGATMACMVLQQWRGTHSEELPSNLRVTLAPDCATAPVAREADIVLLGADRIARSGAVSNKTGSLTAAICARHENPQALVVALSGVEKITATEAQPDDEPCESHSHDDLSGAWGKHVTDALNNHEIDVRNDWFEWVPRELIDVYVTDEGVKKRDEIVAQAEEVGLLQAGLFGEI